MGFSKATFFYKKNFHLWCVVLTLFWGHQLVGSSTPPSTAERAIHAEITRRVYIYSSLVDSRLIVQTHPVVSDLSS